MNCLYVHVWQIQSLALPSGPRPARAKFWQDVATRRDARELRAARDKLKVKFIVRQETGTGECEGCSRARTFPWKQGCKAQHDLDL